MRNCLWCCFQYLDNTYSSILFKTTHSSVLQCNDSNKIWCGTVVISIILLPHMKCFIIMVLECFTPGSYRRFVMTTFFILICRGGGCKMSESRGWEIGKICFFVRLYTLLQEWLLYMQCNILIFFKKFSSQACRKKFNEFSRFHVSNRKENGKKIF